MKAISKILIFFIVIVLAAIFAFYFSKKSAKPTFQLPKPKIEEKIEKKFMKLISPAFGQNQSIPRKYTCDGEDINPPLEIQDIPEGTKSLALIVDDPDAPMGTFVHWIVWNISPETTFIEENSLPTGAIQGMNDFGKNSYGGPCPPFGTHHYHFKLYALDISLRLDPSSRKSALEKAMEGHILDFAKLIGIYKR